MRVPDSRTTRPIPNRIERRVANLATPEPDFDTRVPESASLRTRDEWKVSRPVDSVPDPRCPPPMSRDASNRGRRAFGLGGRTSNETTGLVQKTLEPVSRYNGLEDELPFVRPDSAQGKIRRIKAGRDGQMDDGIHALLVVGGDRYDVFVTLGFDRYHYLRDDCGVNDIGTASVPSLQEDVMPQK